MPITQKEEALVFAAKNGNVKCFEELYKLYYDKIYALAGYSTNHLYKGLAELK